MAVLRSRLHGLSVVGKVYDILCRQMMLCILIFRSSPALLVVFLDILASIRTIGIRNAFQALVEEVVAQLQQRKRQREQLQLAQPPVPRRPQMEVIVVEV